jgi:MinD-like ATPase involved in chromosome partitioning or flagellar assembly
MNSDPSHLGREIDGAYRRLKLSKKRGRVLVELVKSQCGQTVKDAAKLVRRDPDSVLKKWSKKTLESYFELAGVMLLAADSSDEELTLLNDLIRQLDRILGSSEEQKAKAGAQALLESLILAIENVGSESNYQILELLADLSNAPEGVIPPSRQPSKQVAARRVAKNIDGKGRALLRDLLQVGLYREVMTFLQQRESLRDARERGGALRNIRKPVISLASRKGGVGKSMLTFATAAWYLKMRPHAKVCIIDLDLSGPVWQYLLFPERGRPAHFLNDLFRLDQGNQKGEFEFPSISKQAVTQLLEESSIKVEGVALRLIAFADLPRTSRYLSLAFSNNSEACFRFLVELVSALQPFVDLIVIDNPPGFESLPLLSHILTTSVPRGCSVVVSTPALPDLRGTLIELSDLSVLGRDSALVRRPPVWIVNKADSKARKFLSTKHSVVDVANEIEAYNAILPPRPLIARAISASSDKFHGQTLPLDPALLAFGNIKNSGRPPLEDALDTFLETRFFKEFASKVGPVMLPFLTSTTSSDRSANTKT